MFIDFPHVTNFFGFTTCSNTEVSHYSSKQNCKEREAGRRRVGSYVKVLSRFIAPEMGAESCLTLLGTCSMETN